MIEDNEHSVVCTWDVDYGFVPQHTKKHPTGVYVHGNKRGFFLDYKGDPTTSFELPASTVVLRELAEALVKMAEKMEERFPAMVGDGKHLS